ncbi:MAG: hypothetical protein AB8H79_04890 [Myxococcota bacterium]
MRPSMLLVLLAAGCTTEFNCEDQEPQILEWNEVSPFGFSAEGALADFGGPHRFPDATAVGRPEGAGLELSASKGTGIIVFQPREMVQRRRLSTTSRLTLVDAEACVSNLLAPVEVDFAFADDDPIEFTGFLRVSDPTSELEYRDEGLNAVLDHGAPQWMDLVPEDLPVNSVRTLVSITDDQIEASVKALDFNGDRTADLLSVSEDR